MCQTNKKVSEVFKDLQMPLGTLIVDEERTGGVIVVIDMGGNIEFIGDITESDKVRVKSAIKLNEFFKVAEEVYRMLLGDSLFIFRVYGTEGHRVFVGECIEVSVENRLDIMMHQSDYLLSRSEKWAGKTVELMKLSKDY